ncbi:MAG: hypothetical protein QM760_17170 [Nibricoccus sp.]
MKQLLRAVAVLSLCFAAPLFANLTAGGGLIVLSTSTNIGTISSGQTLTLDLVTVEVADLEIRVVNTANNQVVATAGNAWNYYTGQSYNTNYESIDITGLPSGSYRVDMDLRFPDYATSPYQPYPGSPFWWMLTNYFDTYSGYGAIYIDVGASQSDVWSWGGASLIVW